ncbi:MAG TPA: radical SAM protein [Clostridia bacterium]|nr:radical SAM protein [Clostridia bacterium]
METAYELLIEKLSRQASIKKIPLNGAFELTARCNFDCKMCYIHKKNDCAKVDELTTDQWIRLASEARDAGMLSLIMTGGEIFLRKDFREIYESIAKMGFNITLYSNASLIDSKTAKWLGRIPPTTLEITLYGASAETYEKVSGNAEAYEKVVNAIDMLLAEGINIELKTTVISENMDDYDAMAEFSYKRGLRFGLVDYLYPARSASHAVNVCRLTPEKLVEFRKKMVETNKRLTGIYLDGKQLPGPSDRMDKLAQELNSIKPDRERIKSAFGCNAGSSDFWVTWDGRMVPCGAMEEPVLHPLETGFVNAWSELTKGCSRIPICKECRKCDLIDYCMVCPAKLKSETGRYNKPGKYLCELARLSRENFSEVDRKNIDKDIG